MIQPFASSHRRSLWDLYDKAPLNHLISLARLSQDERLLSEGDEIFAYSTLDKQRAHLLVTGVKPLTIERIDKRPVGRPAKEAA